MLWLFVVMFILFVINVPIAWSMAIAPMFRFRAWFSA